MEGKKRPQKRRCCGCSKKSTGAAPVDFFARPAFLPRQTLSFSSLHLQHRVECILWTVLSASSRVLITSLVYSIHLETPLTQSDRQVYRIPLAILCRHLSPASSSTHTPIHIESSARQVLIPSAFLPRLNTVSTLHETPHRDAATDP